MRPPADVLFVLRARIDSGRSKGVPQLARDIRAMKRAENEIASLRNEVEILREQLRAKIGDA